MNWYLKVVAYHPWIILLTVASLSLVSLITSLMGSKLPNFTDPELGFETRGTEISKRLRAWDNLYEAVRPSGSLTVNPMPFRKISFSKSGGGSINSRKMPNFRRRKNKSQNEGLSGLESSTPKIKKDKTANFSLDLETKNINWNSKSHDHDHISNDGFFCEGLGSDFSHLVLGSKNSSESLLTLDALTSVCVIQERLMNQEIMSSICQAVSSGNCCRPWSLPNYITLLANKTSCSNLKEKDVENVKTLIYDCAKYYNNLHLESDCYENKICRGIPENCTKFNAVYNIFYYLTDVHFFRKDNSDLNQDSFLQHTIIFLPIARSTAVLPYYKNLSLTFLKEKNVEVVSMDFGLKNVLFHDYLVRDTNFMIGAIIFMFFCIWMYTNSIILTLCTLVAICFSLLNAYFIYIFILRIKFFPFMNLLATIVAMGIGADDVFIFFKMWQISKSKRINSRILILLSNTMKHSIPSMFVSSITTAAAFFSGYVSPITAINCFSVFAGTAVLVNFFLMVTWVPAWFIITEKYQCFTCHLRWTSRLMVWSRKKRDKIMKVKAYLQKYLILLILKLKWFWICFLAIVAIGGAIAVLYYPKLSLPDSKTLHLFPRSHLFELYDAKYKNEFWFEKLEKTTSWDNQNFKLPLRFVWGVLPIDNGNYLEPNSKGTLVFDSTFNILDPESQVWLDKFCRSLRSQPFYQPTLGPLLLNCFIESFETWMERRCKDSIRGIDRTPCCQTSKFPYSKDVFQKCILEYISSLYETPSDYLYPGVAGPKFSKETEEIKAIIVEYDSNVSYSLSYSEMSKFYTQVDSWFQNQLSHAPPGMSKGWFVSHLGFYDVQATLKDGTSLSIAVSMAVSLVVFFLVTLNVIITLYAMATIACIIFVTVGVLVFIGWSVNVLESVAIISAVGLAVDFSLHYGLTYGMTVESCRETAVKMTVTKITGPIFMAAMTTGAAGLFMLPSTVLAYIQIGIFLIVVTLSGWAYSTFFLMSVLSVAGPVKGFCQFSYKNLFCFRQKKMLNSLAESSCTNVTNMFPESTIEEENKQINSIKAHEMVALTPQDNRVNCEEKAT